MTEYRYIFGSLRTESIIAEIPLFGTYMDNELNVGGRFDGSFNLDMTGFDNQTLMDATIPGRCFVVCEREGQPVWGGYVWSRTYQSQAKTIQLYAQSFEYYPTHQLIRNDFVSTNTEQLIIFNSLWTDMMNSTASRNLNINLPSGIPPTVIPKSVVVAASDFKYYDEIISSLADSADGFDWTIDIGKSGSNYIKTLRAGHPTIGTTDPRQLTFEYPGNILNYYATESMTDAGTNVFTLGSGEGTSMIYTEYVHQDLLDSGSPRWDITSSRKDIDNQAQVDSFGIQEGTIRRPPMLVVKPSLKANVVPEFGSFGLGDACNLVITDSRFPSGFTFSARITKWTLQPQSSENTEEFSIIFAGDENG